MQGAAEQALDPIYITLCEAHIKQVFCVVYCWHLESRVQTLLALGYPLIHVPSVHFVWVN